MTSLVVIQPKLQNENGYVESIEVRVSEFAKKFKYRKYSILLIVVVVILVIMPNSFLNNIESRSINRF